MKASIIAAVLTVAAMNASAWAQAPDPHHPAEGGTPTVTQPTVPSPPGMMDGMADMMRKMQSMHTMMMGPGMAGMGTIDRVEGRIAFLRAELKISDAQANAWNTFAAALRANAQKLAAFRPAMMPQPGSNAQPTLQERLDVQDRWLSARLEGTRAIKAAFTPLVGTFSEDQKKTATELLGPHLGLAMMPGQMGPAQMMMGPR